MTYNALVVCWKFYIKLYKLSSTVFKHTNRICLFAMEKCSYWERVLETIITMSVSRSVKCKNYAMKVYAFSYAWEAMRILGKVVFAFDGCPLIQLKCPAFSRFKLKLFICNSLPSSIIHFDACIPSLVARLFLQWTAFGYDCMWRCPWQTHCNAI